MKIKQVNPLYYIAGIIMATALPLIFSILQPQIEVLLGIQPTVVWQPTYIEDGNNKSNYLNQIDVYNKSKASGDLLIKIPIVVEESSIIIEGSKEKAVFEENGGDTIIKIDSIYENEEISIRFPSDRIIFYGIELASRTFKLKEDEPFPYKYKYGQGAASIVLFGGLFIYFFVMVVITAYQAGRRKEAISLLGGDIE